MNYATYYLGKKKKNTGNHWTLQNCHGPFKYRANQVIWASLVAHTVNNLPVMRSLDWEDPLEKKMANHSSILAWRIPWTEKPGRLRFMGSQRVGHDWATKHILLIVKKEVHKFSHINISLLCDILITVLGMLHGYVLYVAYYRTSLLFILRLWY